MPTSPIDAATVAQQLSGQFPAWRIWKNRGTWHARRRGDFHQSCAPGAPLCPAPAALLPFYGD
jgi:hypothetical protein